MLNQYNINSCAFLNNYGPKHEAITSEKLEHSHLSFQLTNLLLFRKRVEIEKQAVKISALSLIHEMPSNKSHSKFSD